MRLHLKRSLISMLVFLTILPSTLASASTDQLSDPLPVPESAPEQIQLEQPQQEQLQQDQVQQKEVNAEAAPLYQWSFHPGQVVDRVSVVNSVYPAAGAERAELKGVASIVYDDQRGEVLSLPGGGNGTGWLKLPDQLYSGIEDELSISFWANIDSSSGAYSRLLSSTIAGKGLTNAGVSGWQDSEFIVIAGDGTFSNRIYTGTNPNAVASYKGDIVWNRNPARGKWQQVVITMTSSGAYEVYLDGVPVGIKGLDPGKSSSGATMSSVLEHFFSRDYLNALKFNDFGRSLYTSDGDIKGKFDDLRVYNVQLDANQVSALYAATKHEENTSAKPAKISVDLADRSLGPVFHGSSGALYAISEPNVPDINTLIPIKPSHISQKPPNGIQHPTGDALRVSDYFFEAGGEAVNIVMQDYYQHWYYPSRTANEYIQEAVIPITTAVKAYKEQWEAANPGRDADARFIYIPFNEPEQNNTRYPQLLSDNQTGKNSRAVFNSDWLAVTKKIKEIDPGAVISGVNLTQYGAKVFEDFIPYCVENDCLPDIISWHMLWDKAFNQAPSNVATFRTVEAGSVQRYKELYPDRTVPFPIKVDINEYAATSEIAVGGSLIHYIARYDELKMNSMLPYWNTANSYGSLLAGQNEPNGAWWLYKWYADMMGGDMAKIEVINARHENDAFGPGLYGLSSIQDNKKQVGIAFGGTQGDGQIVFNNVTGNGNSPSFLTDAEAVHITVWHAGYTGLTGFLVEPTQILDRDYPVKNGSVTLDVNLNDYTSAYYAVITPAVDHAPKETFYQRFEAENAEVRTNVTLTDHYPRKSTGRSASNGQYVQGIKAADSLVKWTEVTVPADGSYRLDLIGGSGATSTLRNQSNTGDANQRINSEWFIKIDDQPATKVVLRADYNMQLLGGNTIFADLTQGTHSISISKYNPDSGEAGQGESTLDAIELTYSGLPGAHPNYRVQAEFADYDPALGLSRESSLEGFEGAGYVTGYGSSQDANTRFVVSVLQDGMYDLQIRYAASGVGKMQIQHDRKPLVDLPVTDTGGQWKTATVPTFLRTGINLVDVRSSAALSLDYINAAFVSQTSVYSVEAEAATVVGTPAGSELPLIREDAFAKYASGGKYVNGITSYDGAERYLELKDITVSKAGTYKLVVTYANGESAGTHAYNNDVVERYAQVSVNGGEPQTVFFKNTISWQQFATQTFDVELKAGTNSIRFSNNNTYDGGSNPYGGTGAQGFTPYTAVPHQYAPAFDRFDIYPRHTLVTDGGGDPGGGNNGGGDPGGGNSGGGDPGGGNNGGGDPGGGNNGGGDPGGGNNGGGDPGGGNNGGGDPGGGNSGGGDPGGGNNSGTNAGNGNGGGTTVGSVTPVQPEAPSGSGHLTVEAEVTGATATATLDAQKVKSAEQLTVSSPLGTFHFPLKAVDTAAWGQQLGTEDWKLKVSITVLPEQRQQEILQAVLAAKGKLISPAIEYKVTAEANGRTVEIPGFKDSYSRHTLQLDAPADSRNTTVVRIEKDGSFTFVPAVINGTGVTFYSPSNGTFAVISSNKTFEDIKGHWAQASVEKLASKLILTGLTDSKFAPNATTTRAEFAAMMVRALGYSSSGSADVSFKDIPSGAWYNGSVGTAAELGLVRGGTDNNFRPNDIITRQEMTVILVKAMALAGSPLPASELQPAAFKDAGKIAGWAQQDVAKAVQAGLITGTPAGQFQPGQSATRAEAATVILRLLMQAKLMN
ncbi:S-layer homology domain-containing protein [Paenibacillus tritici]|uniref:S-layer homology domain-containing protein n=1 Tax=Paenibacillus tritici TaxID=1873425 RepID=A0ABX2DT86_9BACL|nr:S-layer homology domain-containing protein [Paenibacillus tritici]NQX47903.1 S-layer homology domain-containing protein [Paenibacillus tritici]